MKYAFYMGCLIPARELGYELSVRRVLPELGVELVEMKGTNCCAPFGIQSLDYVSWAALAARNLCIAEEMGLNILALCNDCYESLFMVNRLLRENPETRDQVNAILSGVGKEFKGKVEVKHVVDILFEDVGLEKLKNSVKNPLTRLRVAAQPGCHLVRPKMLHYGAGMGFDALDQLIRVLGPEPVDYEEKETCCGGPLRDIDDNISRHMIRQKLSSLTKANVDCIVTVCPFCYIQLDLGQLELKSVMKEEYNLPVLHFSEVLSLAMGFKPTDLELRDHKIKVNRVLEKL